MTAHWKETRVWAAHLFAAGFLATTFSGCGDGALGGGARVRPSISIKLDAAASDTAATEETNVQVAGYGTITGHVVLDGAKPDLSMSLPANMPDPTVCQRPLIPNERLIVGEGNGIKNVFVFLDRKPPGTRDSAEVAKDLTFDQKHCTYTPHAMIVRTGQPFQLLNSDPIAHNVHTNPTKSQSFNSTLKVSDAVGVPYMYTAAERSPVRVTCDIHAWMLAWQLPLDHPYGAVTDDQGQFTIADVPAGEHRFVVWHEGKKLMEYPVTIQVDQTTPVEIKITSSTLAQAAPARPVKTVVLSAIGN